jgi:AraC family transcriptional regulator of adaptative response/methylated-DNA-[protein]-cysteine methyltransferase
MSDAITQTTSDYQKIAQAIAFIRAEAKRQPSLKEIAASVHTSPFHLQRLFTRWAGISPKRFVQYVTLEHAKERLRNSEDLLTASYESGLSGSGRLHDLFVTFEAVTPGAFKSGGDGLEICHGVHDSPFGKCLIATTDRGICALEFVDDRSVDSHLVRLRRTWPEAALIASPRTTARLAKQIFAGTANRNSLPHLHVRGTNFQTRVWRALLNIPNGQFSTYSRIASAMGSPSASRAVGGAVGATPVAWLIPCHRVLRSDGELGGYHWGVDRKVACLAWEAARAENAVA